MFVSQHIHFSFHLLILYVRGTQLFYLFCLIPIWIIFSIIGVLYSEESHTRAFSLLGMITLRINISMEYNQFAESIRSLSWYHNGTQLTNNSKMNITNSGRSLIVSDLAPSDAGKYELRIGSIASNQGSTAECNRNVLPILKNMALYAPVTFYVQQHKIPSYNPEDIVKNYNIPKDSIAFPQSTVIENIIDVNTHRIFYDLQPSRLFYRFYRDGISISLPTSMYNFTVSYNNTIMLSHRIMYTNSETVTGHYVYIELVRRSDIICRIFRRRFPIFVLYWTLKMYRK